ncbi:MAG: IS200/IS605 family transposase [Candidatus Thermoplasmatota archaeon]|nr:IS200/IS605 family transposase [Candidatus Thermoplasmatota archaeon]
MRIYRNLPFAVPTRLYLYHFKWCPKYRYNMLRKEENLCEGILRETAKERGIEIVEISVMSDHIHLIAGIPPTMSVSEAFRLLKGTSSYKMFRAKPNFRKRYPKGHFWSPGKFYRSVGDADLETTRNYVRNQRAVHQTILSPFF